MTTELDVINEMLGTMGEAPLNQLDEDHPFVAAGRRFLDTANRRLQAKGWWFNKELLKFVPDASSSFVYIPSDIMSVRESDVRRCRFRYIQRGDRLYDLSNSTYEITENPVYLDVVRLVPFDGLDHLAQNAVALQAVLRFQLNYDADPQKTADLKQELADVWMTLNAEHTRQVKANFIYNNSVGGKLALVSPAGGRGRLPYPGIGVR
jgi:hypothetical protein